jgi:hypothetical protein
MTKFGRMSIKHLFAANYAAQAAKSKRKIEKNMAYVHLIFGIVLFIIFLVTGRFMRTDFPDKEIIPQELRLLMRSRHIYILFSALLHLILGIYLRIQPQFGRKILQISGSLLLILASILLIWAFVSETYFERGFSDVSRWGIYLSLGGALLHFIGALGKTEIK